MMCDVRAMKEYVGALEPLLIEEAREGARNAFSESCEAGKIVEAEVLRCVWLCCRPT